MQVVRYALTRASSLALPFLLIACTQPSGSEQTSEMSEVPDEILATGPLLESSCGIVTHGEMHESLSSGQAELVTVKALNTDLVVITSLGGVNAGGSTLVQLQGLTSQGVDEYRRQKGLDLIYQRTVNNAYFVTGGDECSLVVDGGGRGVVGQIFSSTGENINEALLGSGSALPRGEDGCGGEALQACYAAIEVPEEFSPLVINNFLWKPVSDNDGKLVIGVDEFVTVKVIGALTETHPAERFAGFPYVSFIRYAKPGCSYGNNIRVEFYDQNGLRLKTGNGADHVTVASGCSRNEQRF